MISCARQALRFQSALFRNPFLPAPQIVRFFPRPSFHSFTESVFRSKFNSVIFRPNSLSACTSVAVAALTTSAKKFSTLASTDFITTFKSMGIWGWLLVDVGIQWAGWAVSSLLKTEKFYDLLGTGSFLVLAGGSLAASGAVTSTKLLVTGMVGVWGLRLGSYLVARVHKVGKDSRFDEVKHQPGMFLFYWTMQALWVFVTVSPVLIINTATTAAAGPVWLQAVGALVWAAGFACEAVADSQKDAWRARPENKGKFIDEGLWSVSRHPNYFGEMLVWWGIFLASVGGFSRPAHYASVASPLFVMFLLRYVSGVPILERQADARWGSLPEYQAYKSRVPILVPDITKLIK